MMKNLLILILMNLKPHRTAPHRIATHAHVAFMCELSTLVTM